MTTITIDRDLLEQALEALKAGPDVDPIFAGETEEALRAALHQQTRPVQETCTYKCEAWPECGCAPPKAEPVAWECKAGGLKAPTQRQYDCQTAAAELRRLHKENELLASAADKLRMSHSEERRELLRQRDQATAQRDSLLEALKLAHFQIENHCDVGVDEWFACMKKVNAAIKAVEGEKK